MPEAIEKKTLVHRLLKLGIVVLVLAALACLVPLPIPVHKTLSGQSWEDRNPEVSAATEVAIDGIYIKHLIPLFFDDSFSGSIRIAGHEYASHGSTPLMTFQRGSGHFDLLYYFDPEVGEYRCLGMVIKKDYFSEIVIWYSSTNDPRQLVSAPAQSRQEALEMGKRLLPTELALQ